ncbi:MAG: 5-(carboxyamino)imidazole ribonucleotide synthase [Cyanobacteria bacterium CRU_2_1]|nr:5-(carboxyamino)imidazole ribonucleotide synthase [Cyanobacteria bacterium CRU_2_1]
MTKRVGVIGGGQLAWMMAEAATKLDIELVIQTPKPDDPAVSIAAHTIVAPVNDATATAQLAAHCEVITFENEFIDLEALTQLENQGVPFYPRLASIAPLLDKYYQRAYLQNLGLPTPKFIALDDHPNPNTLDPFGFPVVVKARRLSYDGHGTTIVNTPAELPSSLTPHPSFFLLEEFIPFDRELAVMAARSRSGEVITYPVVETQQKNQVCHRVIVTNDLSASVVKQVETIARTLLHHLDFVGIMGIEFFLTRDGNVLVNETAPRTHNSGHYSLDACMTSQFEQQLRAVCQLPLGDSGLTCAGAVMVNLLGFENVESDYLKKRQQLTQIPRSHVYWYGKSESRIGRKLGHLTILLETGQRQEAIDMAEQVETIWYGTGNRE